MKNDVEVIGFDWNKVTLGIYHHGFDYIKVNLHGGGDNIDLISSEPAGILRMTVGDLLPDCQYRVTVIFPDGSEQSEFHTLPAPQGNLKGCYAVLSDPHISEFTENRKGRLFVESASILRDVIEDCVGNYKAEFILIGGDLTNKASVGEYEVLASILNSAGVPVIAAPGDHDITPRRDRWMQYVGDKFPSEFADHRYRVKALDTAGGEITDEDLHAIESMVYDNRLLLLVTHMHILPNPALCHGNKAHGIRNFNATASALLERLSHRTSIIYAGHQNVPSKISLNKLHQVHLPQTCQYGCSWLLVREYENGLYHTHIPIRSEILRRQSAIDGERSADFFREEQWRISYRRGVSPNMANFLIKE